MQTPSSWRWKRNRKRLW